MEITLHQLAIHELVKLPESSQTEMRLSDSLLFVDERAEGLVAQLHRTFSQKNDVLNGVLAAPEDALFPGFFHVLQEANFSDEAFLQFSLDTMDALQQSLHGVGGAKGGYLVYAFYSAESGDRADNILGIFLVRDTNGLIFNHTNGGRFQINSTTYLDIDRLAMAGRIKVRKGQPDWQPAAEVIKHARSQKDISDYFLNWLAVEQPVSNKDLTQHFLEAVAAIPAPVDDATGEPMESGLFREQVANFAMKSPGKTISIPAFEEKFYGEGQPLQDYFVNNDVPLQEEFRIDSQSLRDYNFHRFKGDGLYFGCKHAFLLSGQVRVEGDNVVIDDPELAAQIADIINGL